jgi:hypothetical protein
MLRQDDRERLAYARQVAATGYDPEGRYPVQTTSRREVAWNLWFVATEAGIECAQAGKPSAVGGAGQRRVLLPAEFPAHLRDYLGMLPGSRLLGDYQRTEAQPEPERAFVEAGYALHVWVAARYTVELPVNEQSQAFGRRVLARRHIGEMKRARATGA